MATSRAKHAGRYYAAACVSVCVLAYIAVNCIPGCKASDAKRPGSYEKLERVEKTFRHVTGSNDLTWAVLVKDAHIAVAVLPIGM